MRRLKIRKNPPAPPPKNLAAEHHKPPHNHAGFGKYWIGETLMDIATDKPIMSKAALDSLRDRR